MYFPNEPAAIFYNGGYLLEALADQSWEMIEQLTEHWHPEFKRAVWARLSPKEKDAIAKLKAEYQVEF